MTEGSHFAVPPGSENASALTRSVSATAMLEAFQRFLPPRDRTRWEACELARVRYLPGKVWHVLYRLWRTGQGRGDEPSYETTYLRSLALSPGRPLVLTPPEWIPEEPPEP